MPYPFSLPTTSKFPISNFLRCETHPSLILAATTRRNILHAVLKKHNQLSGQPQASNLVSVLNALNDYLPFLLAIEAGVTGARVGDEEVDVCLEKEVEVAWKPGLSNAIPGRDLRKVKGKGLDYEICFVLTTLAYTHTLLARKQLHTLYASVTPSADQRTKAIEAAMRHLLQANSIHSNASTRAADFTPPPGAKDVLSETQNALSEIAFAEATLLAILQNDPYLAIVIQDRNKDDKEWMYKTPEIPKVRAAVYIRVATCAVEHVSKAQAPLSGTDESFSKYVKNLQKTANAKACRFSGIDAELSGKIGQGIGWLMAGKRELGFKVSEDSSKVKGFAKFKKEWSERREDKKIERGESWGVDAGRIEEGRVLDLLETKWTRTNDVIDTQVVPPADSLLPGLPSGREIHKTKPFVPPQLDADVLAQMRAPIDRSELSKAEAGSDDDSDGENPMNAPGAFPQNVGQESSYY